MAYPMIGSIQRAGSGRGTAIAGVRQAFYVIGPTGMNREREVRVLTQMLLECCEQAPTPWVSFAGCSLIICSPLLRGSVEKGLMRTMSAEIPFQFRDRVRNLPKREKENTEP